MPPLNPFSKSCVALAVSQLLLVPAAAQAATITVNSNTDDGTGCTLRDAIASANNASDQNNGCAIGGEYGTDQIIFDYGTFAAPSNTIALTNGQLSVGAGKDIYIDAANTPGGITIDGNFESRLLDIRDATVSINSITLTRGGFDSGASDSQSAVLVEDSTLTLANSTLSNNIAASYYNSMFEATRSEVTIANSSISNNSFGLLAGYSNYLLDFVDCSSVTFNDVVVNDNKSAYSLIVFRGGNSVSINASTVSSNSANGTNILEVRGTDSVSITNSTISDNTSGFDVIRLNDNSATITNSTLSNNTPTRASATGVLAVTNTALNLVNSTINSPAFDANFNLGNNVNYSGSANVSVVNSIVTDSSGPDCAVSGGASLNDISSDSNSIMQGAGCNTQARSVDPLLGPLADNGGPTLTHSLLSGSPAINTGDNATCAATDQRGETRPLSARNPCDVGAFESDELIEPEGTFFVVPTKNGKSVIVEL